MSTETLTVEDVYTLTESAFIANGASPEHAAAVARTVSTAERDGAASHGVFRLPGYLKALRSGKVKGGPSVTVEKIAPSVLRVNGDNCFAPLAHEVGRDALIALARETGIAAQAIVKTHHFNALWAETEPLAEAGLAAFACTAYMPTVAPAGARRPFFGTNPIAFAWPRGDGNAPMVFDMATSAMARGEMQIAARDGHPIPEGAGIDKDGNATTDPDAILKGGAQLTFGGYKGSAIALMVELLCAGLIGETFSDESKARDNGDGGPPEGGEFLLAIDPARFGDAANWRDHSEQFLQRLVGLEGDARLPGDGRRTRRERVAREGVVLPKALLNDVRSLM